MDRTAEMCLESWLTRWADIGARDRDRSAPATQQDPELSGQMSDPDPDRFSSY